jgi:hypothetical protein
VKQTVYTVHAYRWGDRECHSYTIGVYPKKHAALKAAETERVWRGGKYECEVLEWTLGEGIEARNVDGRCKTILALPGNTLKRDGVSAEASR